MEIALAVLVLVVVSWTIYVATCIPIPGHGNIEAADDFVSFVSFVPSSKRFPFAFEFDEAEIGNTLVGSSAS